MRKLIIAGFIGNDAQVNDLSTTQVINFSVATTDKFKEETRTTWVKCSYFTNNVTIAPYLKKSTYVIVEGRAEVELYTDQNQQSKVIQKLIVDRVEFGGAKTESSTETNNSATTAPAATTPPASTQNFSPQTTSDEDDSDLPF